MWAENFSILHVSYANPNTYKAKTILQEAEERARARSIWTTYYGRRMHQKEIYAMPSSVDHSSIQCIILSGVKATSYRPHITAVDK